MSQRSARLKYRVRRALWITAMPLTYPARYAENRLDRAMRCPECGHGGELTPELAEEHADGCECTDPLCACNPEAVDFGEAPR